MSNKVFYGLKNVHWASITETEGGATYGTPKALPGAVSLSLTAEGDTTTFYADNTAYYVAVANNGYSGDLEVANLTEEFMTEVLGMVKESTKGLLVEKADAQPKSFALLFQFEGDESARKYCLYDCKCTRPSIESGTSTESVEVRTMTASFTAKPRFDGVIKAQSTDASGSAYATWFTAVPDPTGSK